MPGPWDKYASPAPSEGPWAKYAPKLAQPSTFQDPADEAVYRQKLAEEQQARTKPAIPFYASEPGGEERNLTAERRAMAPEKAAVIDTADVQAKRYEQEAFDKTRTPSQRAIDTAVFVPSAAVRMATRGEYGIGDVADKISPGMGQSLREREADFARANERGLQAAADFGAVASGIPQLSTLGPAGAVGMAFKTLANKPLPPSTVLRATTRNDRLADIDAFNASGVRPFGPALTEAGTAGVVKQLSEAPIVGAPVRNRLLGAIEETRDAGERIAGKYGDARTYRDVGNVAENILNRFKDTRVEKIAGRESAAPTPDARLGEIAKAPARETSIKTKQDALYERAWRGIPEDMAQGRSKKGQERFVGGMANTQATLKEISERNQRMYAKTRGNEPVDPKLSYPVRGGVPGQIVEDILEGRWRGNLQAMRDVRSNFRRLTSGIADTEKNTLTLSDMRRLQSSMTQDMIGLLKRNADDYAKAGNATAAQNVNRAVHDFRRADQFTRASAQRLETIEKLYGAQSAEQLALGIAKDAMGGRKGGNFARLAGLRRSVRDEEWNDIASGIIREMGRPIGSARGATEEAGFSVNSFMTNWNNMSQEGKNILFRNAETKELGDALDKFVRVADRMANFEAMANTSRSATNALGITGLASIFTAAQQALTGNFQTAAAAASVAGGTYAFGKFMSSPAYVRWLTRAVELSGDRGGTSLTRLSAHARELARLASNEPDPAMQALAQAVAAKLSDVGSAQGQNSAVPAR